MTAEVAFGAAPPSDVESIGRTMLAVGPGRGPFPLDYRRPDGSEIALTFERQLEVSDNLIDRHDDILGRRTGICLIMPVYKADDLAADKARISEMSEAEI